MNQRPISAYQKLGGLYFFPRTLDKIRKHARGELHPEHHEFLGKGFDGRLCHFLGISYDALRERVLAGGSDDDILAWTQQHGRKLTDVDAMIWNGFAAKRGWRDDATPGLERNKADSGLAHRTDLLTFFDYYEVDEGRAPR
jgi:gluconokinase